MGGGCIRWLFVFLFRRSLRFRLYIWGIFEVFFEVVIVDIGLVWVETFMEVWGGVDRTVGRGFWVWGYVFRRLNLYSSVRLWKLLVMEWMKWFFYFFVCLFDMFNWIVIMCRFWVNIRDVVENKSEIVFIFRKFIV